VWQVDRFVDRTTAGNRLAAALTLPYRGKNALVLGIPRGGVPVAAEVARALDAELDVIVARKAGVPGHPELALGAVTSDGARFVNDDLISGLGLSQEAVDGAFEKATREAREREVRFRSGRPKPKVRDRTVIVVDDGVATGATMLAALRSVRSADPARLVAAVPVGAPETCELVAREADELVCLERPAYFVAVGQFYEHFPQVSDEQARDLLRRPDHGDEEAPSDTPVTAG
jgi:putative phosphoribosyl transferase